MTSVIFYQQAPAFLLACAIKATILLLCAWVFAGVLSRLSAAIRHHVWAAAVLASLALPFLIFALPAWHSSALGNAASLLSSPHAGATNTLPPAATSATVNVAASAPLIRNWPLVVLLLWVGACSLIALRLLTGLVRLAWISARAKPLFDDAWMAAVLSLSDSFKIRRPVRLLQCRNPLTMPLTWGVFRPVIVLPATAEQWPADRRDIVLSHELAHISRNDWFLQICAELARAIYWFHPLQWLAAAQLRQESERACDDAVLRSGIAPSVYAGQLLDLARNLENSGRAWSTALAIARPSNLERRFSAMLNPSLNRQRLSWRTKLFVPFLALCLLLPLAALRLPAENFSGKISGTIYDPSGATVPNATIIMSNHAANTVDMTGSDREGNFVFKGLPAGNYEFQVLKPGFKPYRVPEIPLDPGRDFSQAVNLEIGSIKDEVKVVAQGPSAVSKDESGKPSRIHVGGNIQAPKIITKVQPIYPAAAKSAGVEGTVVLHAVIGMDGKPLSLQVVSSQVDPELARSALEAVSQWRYTPTLLNGEPIEVDTTIDIVYSLQP